MNRTTTQRQDLCVHLSAAQKNLCKQKFQDHVNKHTGVKPFSVLYVQRSSTAATTSLNTKGYVLERLILLVNSVGDL